MSDIQEWDKLAKQLKALKIKEANLRRDLCELIINKAPMKNGRVTVKSNMDGLDVKAVQALGYNVDNAVLGTVWHDLSPAEKAVFKMVPTLKIGDYKKLPEDSLVHEAIISKLSMPTLEVTVPVSV